MTDRNGQTHPLIRPYHERVIAYRKARDRIFANVSLVKRSTRRISDYYRRLKSLKPYVISLLFLKILTPDLINWQHCHE